MLAIESIDLNGYTLEEANKIIEQFINESYLENVKKLIVVTGKGPHSQNDKDPLSFKRFRYFKIFCAWFYRKKSRVNKKNLELKDADIKDGGSDVFYIYLKKST